MQVSSTITTYLLFCISPLLTLRFSISFILTIPSLFVVPLDLFNSFLGPLSMLCAPGQTATHRAATHFITLARDHMKFHMLNFSSEQQHRGAVTSTHLSFFTFMLMTFVDCVIQIVYSTFYECASTILYQLRLATLFKPSHPISFFFPQMATAPKTTCCPSVWMTHVRRVPFTWPSLEGQRYRGSPLLLCHTPLFNLSVHLFSRDLLHRWEMIDQVCKQPDESCLSKFLYISHLDTD